ncbi:fasciclin-like arabinogalactan protein 14 [Hibiscus syriacus]|uniref:fasciclin-like arabinogalactan protein 14 n=1 Tax=Hibiscus syriacus TaxID=106335 RepID=UPI0019233593|nr:fasciclin-like arabinogalactan protein 14 [Hibiscus syriacus]
MSSPDVAFFFAFLFFLLASGAANLDIGKTLSSYSDFSDFVNMLNETGVADEINSKQTVTVLVVSNGNLGSLYGQTMETKKMVLSVHVVLDYYDETKLNKSHSKTAKILTTLYQQTGKARNQVGFLNMTNTGTSAVVFSSSSPNSHLEAQLVKQVTSKPYDLSVLQISNLIDVASVSLVPSPSNAPDYAPPPRKVLAPATTPSPDEVDNQKSPAPSKTKASDASPPDADAPGPGSDVKKSAVSAPCGDYLVSTILLIFTCAWLLLTMM